MDSDHVAALALPAIAHWRGDHYVVIDGVGRGSVRIIDPSGGRRTLTASAFAEGFSGVALEVQPGPAFDPAAHVTPPFWRAYVRQMLAAPGVKRALWAALGASVCIQLLGLAAPLFTKLVVDDMVPSGASDLLPLVGAAMALLALSHAAVRYARARLIVHLQFKLDRHLMKGFVRHLLDLPYPFFQQRSTGDLLQRLGSNALIREVLSGQVTSVLLDAGFALFYLVVLAWLAPVLAAVALVIGLFEAAVAAASTPTLHRIMQHELRADAESKGYLVQVIRGAGTVKASGAEAYIRGEWEGRFEQYLGASVARGVVSANVDAAVDGFRLLGPVLLLWVGAGMVLGGTLSLGTMLAATAVAGLFLAPVLSLVAGARQLQLVGAHLNRIADVMTTEPERRGEVAPRSVGRIQLDGVCFRYAPEAEDVIRDVSLTIEPGQKVAVVGATGSGKSTLASLVLGLYDPSAGRVVVDGNDMADLDRGALRRRFGVVMQEPMLLAASIRDNIAFGNAEVSDETVTAAARVAAIHDDIVAMPMGYATPLAEGGGGMSGGQRQRLALARALAQSPDVLVLDEATSHLDAITERVVEVGLSRLACTRLVIAHRLTTVKTADVVVLLAEGRIEAKGTHEGLLSSSASYRRLMETQAFGSGLGTGLPDRRSRESDAAPRAPGCSGRADSRPSPSDIGVAASTDETQTLIG